MTHLLLTVRFLDDCYHGLLAEGGPPEWPPSPFRLFCALVAGVARRGELEGDVGKALAWLQKLDPPVIIAPVAMTGRAITRYVPNNDGDKSPDRQKRLGTKPTIPTLFQLSPNRKAEVHYLWNIHRDSDVAYEHIRTAARSLTALGWGIDMAFADARLVHEEEIRRLSGTRWRPTRSEENGDGIMLRVPTADAELQESTLEDLKHCHQTAIQRISHGKGLHTVDAPRVFNLVRYGAAPRLPIAAFEIHRTIDDQEANPGRSRFRPFHHVRRVADVAGMVRHATAQVARRLGFSNQWVDHHVLGHGNGKHGQATTDERLMFLPLPSITPVGVSGIRRVLIVGWPGFDIAPFRRRLNGEEFIAANTKRPVAMLSAIPATDRNVTPFLGEARTWSTVSPVLLPGYDDPDRLRAKLKARVNAEVQKKLLARLDERIRGLIWKAFDQAGWTADALDGAEVEYRPVGWLRGLEPARNYLLPPLTYPRYHVRVTFPRPIQGPLILGAGRYRGFGLFVR